MKKLNVNTTEGKLTLHVPSEVNDITLAILQGLEENPNATELETLSILTGEPVEKLYTVRNVDELLSTILPVMNELNAGFTQMDKDTLPKKLTLTFPNGRAQEIKLSSTPGFYSYGAVQDAIGIIRDEFTRMEQAETQIPCTKALAGVLGCLLFNLAYPAKVPTPNEMEEFTSEVVGKLPAFTAAPLAKYFFFHYPNLPVMQQSNWHRLLQKLKSGLEWSSSTSSAT